MKPPVNVTQNVDDTEENLEKCICKLCPTFRNNELAKYSPNALFCARGESKIPSKIKTTNCYCLGCDLFIKHGLVISHLCVHGWTRYPSSVRQRQLAGPAILPRDCIPWLHFHFSLAWNSYIHSSYDDRWTANTQAAGLPATIAATNGHTWEYGLPVWESQINLSKCYVRDVITGQGWNWKMQSE